MNTVVESYIIGLKDAYFENNGKADWEHFEKVIHGADKENIDELKQLYPEIPIDLIDLLQYVDGTYWRKYEGEEITFFLLGSDLREYPYYLLSSREIIENQSHATKYYSEYIEREFDEVVIDDRITNRANAIKWLHFSDCMNNGGTSQLFIDFSPSDKGKKGQVIRFLHDPDEIKVIADSFKDYLRKLMENQYDFINKDIMEF